MTQAENINAEKINNAFDAIYKLSINGIPNVSNTVEEMANDYLSKSSSPEKAAKHLINMQMTKSFTTGAIQQLPPGAFASLTIPADLASVAYIQIRMVAAVAYIGGYDVKSDQVESIVYMCLLGHSIGDAIKDIGLIAGQKFIHQAIMKIPGRAIIEINKAVGFRFITKAGEKGLINLDKDASKIVSILLSGGFDLISTKAAGRNAYSFLIENVVPGKAMA